MCIIILVPSETVRSASGGVGERFFINITAVNTAFSPGG